MTLSLDADFDVEAAFEAELAKLDKTGPPLDVDVFLTANIHESLQDDEDGDSEEDEPVSLLQLRLALQRRDLALEQFGKDMDAAYQEFSAVTSGMHNPTQAPASGPFTKSIGPAESLTGAVPNEQRPEATADVVASGLLVDRDEKGAFVRNAADKQVTTPGLSPVTCWDASPEAAYGNMQGEGTTETPSGDEMDADWKRRAGAEVAAEHTATLAVMVEGGRQAAAGKAEAAAQTAQMAAAAERERQEAAEAAAAERVAQLAAGTEREHQAAADLEAQIAAAAADQEQLVAEREAMAMRLEAMRRAQAEREAARASEFEAIRREAEELARRHLAASRIARAWQRYRAGPARVARHAAAVAIQSGWRGCQGRRLAAQRRRQQDALRAVEEAAKANSKEELEAAVQRARDLGLADAVEQRVMELQRAADGAAARLGQAALSGSHLEFQSALVAARAFPQLARQVAEHEAAFERRRKVAEEIMHAAAADQPMLQFMKVLETVGSLVLEQAALKTAVEVVRRRDAEVAAQLAAAAAAAGSGAGSRFDAAAFEALMVRGTQLGLKGDVAAARHAVERQRRELAHELQARAPDASAADLLGLAAEARRLGMAAEAEQLERQLEGRRQEIQAAMQRAEDTGSAVQVAELIEQSIRFGDCQATVEASRTSMRQCQAEREQALTATASTGGLHTYLMARGIAARCGLGLRRLLGPDRTFQERRGAALRDLAAMLRRVCRTAQPAVAAVSCFLTTGLGLSASTALLGRLKDQQQLPGGPGPVGTTEAPVAVAPPSRQPQPTLQQPGYPGHGGPGSSSPGSSAVPARSRGAGYLDRLRPDQPPPWLRSPADMEPPRGCVTAGALATGGSVAAIRGAGSMHGQDQGGAIGPSGELTSSLWSLAVCAVRLGLMDAACLATCTLELQAAVQRAQGLSIRCDVLVARDYWGLPTLPGLPQELHRAGAGPAAARDLSSDGDGRDELATRVVRQLARPECCAAVVRVWSAPTVLLAAVQAINLSNAGLPSAFSSASASAMTLPADGAAGRSLLDEASGRGPTPAGAIASPSNGSAFGAAKPLTRQVLLRNAVGVSSASAAAAAAAVSLVVPAAVSGPPALDRVTKLDLGLEQLSNLAGLDCMCPALRTLAANTNQLTSLEGLPGLVRLRELSVRHNRITSCLRQAGVVSDGGGAGQESSLPAGKVLRRLALDSNLLSGRLSGLESCSGLKSLGLSDNAITDLGASLASSASSLTRLDVRANCLASLASLTPSITAQPVCLRQLDVSGNRLTTLEGIQYLPLLQCLNASNNALTDLPQPLWLPQLTFLDLSHNSLSSFGCSTTGATPTASPAQSPIAPCWYASPVVPALECLVLNDNHISRLGPLGPHARLTALDLSFNRLPSLDTLTPLVGLTALLRLNVSDNPASDPLVGAAPGAMLHPLGFPRGGSWGSVGAAGLPPPHRAALLSWLPSLSELDHDVVAPEERARATVAAAAGSSAASIALLRSLRGSGGGGALVLPSCLQSRPGRRAQVHKLAGSTEAAAVPWVGGFGDRVVGAAAAARTDRRDRRPRVPGGSPGVAARRRGQAGSPLAGVCAGAVHRADAFGMQRQLTAQTGGHLHPHLLLPLALPSCKSTGSAPRAECGGVAPARRNGGIGGVPELRNGSLHSDGLWAALAPSEAAEMTRRQLQELQRLGPRRTDGSEGRCPAAWWPPSPPPPPPPPNFVESFLLDTASLCGLRLLTRALRRLWEWSDRSASAAACAALAAEAESRWEEEESAVLCRHAEDRAARQGDGLQRRAWVVPLLAPKASFYVGRMRGDAAAAAVAMQGAVRGVKGRRWAEEMRSDDWQGRCEAAATRIQSWWRGHRVRTGGRLRELEARRQVTQREEDERRQAAATKIQAYYRGHRVRRRLHAALAAARTHLPGGGAARTAGDTCGPPAIDDSSSDGGDEELEALLGFLQPVGQWLLEEQDSSRTRRQGLSEDLAAPPRPSWGLQQQASAPLKQQPPQSPPAPPPPPQHQQQQELGVAGGPPPVSGAAVALRPVVPPGNVHPSEAAAIGGSTGAHASPRPPNPSSAPPGRLPPLHLSNPEPSVQAPLHVHNCPGPQLVEAAPSCAATSAGWEGSHQRAWGTPVQAPPPQLDLAGLNDESGGSIGGLRNAGAGEWPGDGGGEAMETPGSTASPSAAGGNAAGSREKRHMERVRALMAEWGFQDLATAEAYYRRTQRQQQGKTRRKLQDKYRDPAQRLQKLQQVVESRHAAPAPHAADGRPHQPHPAESRVMAGPISHLAAPEPGPAAGRPFPDPSGTPVLSRRPGATPGGGGSEGSSSPLVRGTSRPLRNLNSADGRVTVGVVVVGGKCSSGGSLPRSTAGGGLGLLLPPIGKRSSSQSAGSPAGLGSSWRQGPGGEASEPAQRPAQVGAGVREPFQAQALSGASSAPQSPLLLPPLANNWMHSPAHTPPRSAMSGGSDAAPVPAGDRARGISTLQLSAAPPGPPTRGVRGSGSSPGSSGGRPVRQPAVQTWRGSR